MPPKRRFISCEICDNRASRSNNEKRMFMARFPLDEARCKQWVKFVGKEDLIYVPIEKLHTLKYVCGNHFENRAFNRKKNRLKTSAVPSKNLKGDPLPDEMLLEFPSHIYSDNDVTNNNKGSSFQVGHSNTEPSSSGLQLSEHDYCTKKKIVLSHERKATPSSDLEVTPRKRKLIKTGIYKDRNPKKDGRIKVTEKFGITSNLRTYANNEEKKKISGSAGGKPIKWFVFTQNTGNIALDSESSATNVTETTDTDFSGDTDEVVESGTTDSLETLDATLKPRGMRSKTTTYPLLEKAQNIICHNGNVKKCEYADFGQHIANKLSKYDDFTRAQAEFKIMKILYECDMSMRRTRASSTCTENPHNNSRGGACSSQSQYTNISIPLHTNNCQYIIVPAQDVTNSNQTQSELNS